VHRTPLVLGMAALIVVLTVVAGGLWWRSAKAQAAAAASADTTSAEVAALVRAAAIASASASTPSTGNPPPPPTIPSSDAAPPLAIEELVTRTMPAVVTVETATGPKRLLRVGRHRDHEQARRRERDDGEPAVEHRRAWPRASRRSWDVDIAVLKVAVANPSQVFLPLAVPSDVHQGKK
jgi:hypothetical protein